MLQDDRNNNLVETPLDTEDIYMGRMLRVERMRVSLPDGRQAQREIVRHPGAVAILAETPDGRVLVVHQWRAALNRILVEIPAGKLEPGEDPTVCAHRELQEETGFVAGELLEIARFATSPGFSDEMISLYYASDLQGGVASPDADEFLQVVELSRSDVERLVKERLVDDAKTLLAFQWWLVRPTVK